MMKTQSHAAYVKFLVRGHGQVYAQFGVIFEVCEQFVPVVKGQGQVHVRYVVKGQGQAFVQFVVKRQVYVQFVFKGQIYV